MECKKWLRYPCYPDRSFWWRQWSSDKTGQKIKVDGNDILLWQWHLCLVKADEQILPLSLVCKQTFFSLSIYERGYSFQLYSHWNSFMQNSVTFKISKRALVVKFDVNMHKDYIYRFWIENLFTHIPRTLPLLWLFARHGNAVNYRMSL